ncbi:MAG: glutathione-disulfide reductase, partial [Methylobacter sp.]
AEFEDAEGYGWSVGHTSFDWPTLIAQKDREIARLEAAYTAVLQKAGVTIVKSRAVLADAHTVQLASGERVRAAYVLIAAGGAPSYGDPIPGIEHAISSNEAFHLPQLPKHVVIQGGGYIAVEFASILHGFGVHIILCHRGHKLLRGFDEDIRDYMVKAMPRKGINLLLNTDIEAIESKADCFAVRLGDGSKVQTDMIMCATGRTPNSTGFGLEALGVELDSENAIKVNANYQTSVPSIYAVGDVTNRINLTPVALAEGTVLVNKLYGDQSGAVDYDIIPTAVFCQPNIGTVGLTEAQAREKYPDIDVYKSSFTPMKNTLSGIDEKSLIKMIVVRSTGRVVGMHMVGTDAPEIIQGMTVAMRAGATKAVFDSTIGVHPTAAEEFVTLRTAET